MASWQYDLFLIGEGDELPLLAQDGWELPALPATSTLDAQGVLVSFFGQPWLMMDDWIVFGNEQGTRVDFLFDESDCVEIHIRIDASAVDAKLEAICAFAGALGGRLFDPMTRALVQPEPGSLATALASSRAAAFSRSPRSLLAGLENEQ